MREIQLKYTNKATLPAVLTRLGRVTPRDVV
jgi:hypothetical protein